MVTSTAQVFPDCGLQIAPWSIATCLRTMVVVAVVGAAGPGCALADAVPGADIGAADPVAQLKDLVSDVTASFDALNVGKLRRKAIVVDRWIDDLATYRGLGRPDEFMRRVGRLVGIQSRVDALLGQMLAVRVRFAAQPPGPGRREAARNYLLATSTLIDLSGRTRYRLYDAIDDVAFAVAELPDQTARLVDLLSEGGSSIGAVVMANALFDPPENSPNGAKPASRRTQKRLLELIASTQQLELLPVLAALVGDPQTPPPLVIAGADAIRRTGLPQAPRPGRDAALPNPPITARQLHDVVCDLDPGALHEDLADRRDRLLNWLAPRVGKGIDGDSYRLGRFEVRSGDWLLMRNPSPYNLFTDLSPGLFTHVGVLTVERGGDGIRRMVVVDLPERGKRMQAVTVDTFVQRTLYYLVLRHPDPSMGRVMGARAREAIERRTEFDLNFRTQRVQVLRGQPLAGKKIHTYCAGLLLLCAQETGLDRRAFFPLPERPAGGNTVRNLAKLGLTFGRDFISPTGALFSPNMEVVGRCDPMYEPRREVQEAVYDHFAERLAGGELTPAPDWVQMFRLKLAETARSNPLLAQAMTNVAGVDRDTDLVSAAKTLTVVETLDQIAQGSSDEFYLARAALMAGPESEFVREGYSPEEIGEMRVYRGRHEELLDAWQTARISFRELNARLVTYYIEQGKGRLGTRFFRVP